MLLYQALQERINENEIEWEMVFSKIHSYKNTHAAVQSLNVQCSVYSTRYKPFGKSICGGQF